MLIFMFSFVEYKRVYFLFSHCVSCLSGSGLDAWVQHCTTNNITIKISLLSHQQRGVGIVPEQVHRGWRHRQVLHIQHAVQPPRNLPASMHHRLLYKQRRKL